MTDGDPDLSALRRETEDALGPFAEAFRADGYAIRIEAIAPSAIHLRIEALEGACEDCLVPEGIMKLMIAESLPGPMRSAAIRIDYPRGAAGTE